MTHFIEIDAEKMRIAAAGVTPLPIEQSAAWENYDRACGRSLWRRLAWVDEAEKVQAIIALTEYSLRGIRFLWARNGPVWLKSASPQREQQFRKELTEYIRMHGKRFVFARIHCWWNGPDIFEPLQIITYDRTVLLDCGDGDAEKIMESMPKDGRRAVRKSLRRIAENNAQIVELKDLTRAQFEQAYAVLQETAQRDGFSPHDASTYWKMIRALGPDHARMFAVLKDDQIICWDLVLVHDRRAAAYYGASSAQARRIGCADGLDFEVARLLGAEGVQAVDLMGIDSPRVPSLYSVGTYKRKFAHRYTDLAGAFDLPIKPAAYRVIKQALQAKHAARRLVRRG